MNGALANAAAILLGGAAGLLLRGGISEALRKSVMQSMGLAVVVIALRMAFQSQNSMALVVSLAVGTSLGVWLDLDGKMDRFAAHITARTGNRFGDVGQGFVSASLIYCLGAMGIVGALSEGLTGDASTLFAKAMIDGVMAVIFSASMGLGVLFSAVPVLLYEGAITLGASFLAAFFSGAMLAEMSGVGGVLVLAIGINMLEVADIRIANLLPAIFVAFVIVYFGF
ncbi:MAG: DUF554 domain-containing protein [Schwartzia sp.]|nr:DUF554 domain-containing protein [Schwartzia sp. (in: firmicutes)]